MKILCQEIDANFLSPEEISYFNQFANQDLDLQEIWQLMDQAWDEVGAGYTPAETEAVGIFYDHPVWLLNGIFTECDPTSAQHRENIAKWIATLQPDLVADFGGGYGSLGRKIADLCPKTEVKIVEPHPRELAKHLAKQYSNLEYTPKLPQNADIVIAQDVLEHIPDPLDVFGELLKATKVGGRVITANCFRPVIKCHLPETFHFRYSFKWIAPKLGCNYKGTVPSVRHAEVFRKTDQKVRWSQARRLEKLSRFMFPIIETTKPVLKAVRSLKR
ncbi:class I SAM-dependent methyltransferase [Dactylococcopsis salina]|uniref:Methyltransferase type 12 domain-containing protein n=1 Tax=Dactylococcopsis salina (strain PCC 8305) TaxID=13035 RepID=K9YRG1_DACS8|nr:class I SAM-dependent methyltransferase [Dactylococcopsis salina]AFZ49072.1 hypothetical protein Dacsa_0265 [Dactylococcopsis salina PCC 8305]